MLLLTACALVLASLLLSCSGAVYNIETVKIGNLEAQNISNTVTGEFAIVVNDFGGRVEELVLMAQGNQKLRDILLTHNGNATAITENAWWKGMILLPWANRIAKGQYHFYNGSYQLPVNENTTNPTHLNSLHGFMAGKKMYVVNAQSTDNAAVLTLGLNFDGNEPGYPFKLTLYIDYTLDKNGFKLAFMIINNMDTTPLPFYMGWHPYFKCDAYQAYVTLDPCGKWTHVEMNENFNPTGITALYNGLDGSQPIGGTLDNPTFYDDEFKIMTSASDCHNIETKLYDPKTDQTVVLWQDPNFRIVHVFTGSASLFKENAVAIEPMSGMADSYNNHDHLSILSGAEEWRGEFGVYVK